MGCEFDFKHLPTGSDLPRKEKVYFVAFET